MLAETSKTDNTISEFILHTLFTTYKIVELFFGQETDPELVLLQMIDIENNLYSHTLQLVVGMMSYCYQEDGLM